MNYHTLSVLEVQELRQDLKSSLIKLEEIIEEEKTMTNTKYKLYNVYKVVDDERKELVETYISYRGAYNQESGAFYFDELGVDDDDIVEYPSNTFYWEEEPDKNKTIQSLFSHSYFRGTQNPHECFAHLLGVSRNRAKELAVAISYYGVQATTPPAHTLY